jgi:phosphoglycolate phosphatase
MFKYRHIIWDWNGTLLDDAWLCVDVMNGMLARRRLPPLTAERYQVIFDFPVIDYYRRAGFDFAVDPFEQLSDEFITEYRHRVLTCGLRAGTRETLAWARDNGITQSVLSAMKQEDLDTMIDHFDLRTYFTDIVGIADHHAAGKVESAQRWIAAQDLHPADMVFIGDTTHDYEVAQILGVDCYHIPGGHHARDRLVASGARVLESLADLYQ